MGLARRGNNNNNSRFGKPTGKGQPPTTTTTLTKSPRVQPRQKLDTLVRLSLTQRRVLMVRLVAHPLHHEHVLALPQRVRRRVRSVRGREGHVLHRDTSLFRTLVLGCINTDFGDQWLSFQHVSRSTNFFHFRTACNSKIAAFLLKFRKVFVKFCKICFFFENFEFF